MRKPSWKPFVLSFALACTSCATQEQFKPGPGAPEVVEVPRARLPAIPPEVLDESREESFLDRLLDFYQVPADVRSRLRRPTSTSSKPTEPTTK